MRLAARRAGFLIGWRLAGEAREHEGPGVSGEAIGVLGLLALSIDGIVWGVAACTLYHWMVPDPRRWLGPALVAGLLFVVWDQWVFAELAHWAGFPRQAAGPLETGIQIAGTLVGFRTGRTLIDRIRRRRSARAGASEREIT
jgi:hypothetical protein